MSQTVTITTYRDEFKQQIGLFISSIQQDYGIPITLEEQPDLQDIPKFYQNGTGNFWIALDGKKLIGTIALIDRGNHSAILRKMFVHSDYRGAAKGVSGMLLDTLLQWAKSRQIKDIFLGTTDRWPAAPRFYEKNGFHLIDDDAMPPHISAVRMKVDNRHYHKELAA